MLIRCAIIVNVINNQKKQRKEVDGAMEEMKKMELTEQQKKDVETFAQLPEDIRKHLLSYGAGILAGCQATSKVIEKMAG